ATHVAFSAPDRASVDAFYEAAVAAGGKDNGAPGLRPHYHETYYAAYVHDPDGNNIEAGCPTPQGRGGSSPHRCASGGWSATTRRTLSRARRSSESSGR